METISGCESLIKIEQQGEGYLVKTKHSSVAERMVSCCESADCDFCIARCKSFCGKRREERKIFKSHESAKSETFNDLQTCSQASAWQASNWETREWRDASGMERRSAKTSESVGVWDQIERTWRMTYGEEERHRRYKLEDEVEGEDLLPYVALRPKTVIIMAQRRDERLTL